MCVQARACKHLSMHECKCVYPKFSMKLNSNKIIKPKKIKSEVAIILRNAQSCFGDLR